MATTAVITGAASGMGRACVDVARDLADEIVAVDLTAPSIDATRGLACDIADPTAVASLVDQVAGLGQLRAPVRFLLSDAASFVSGIDLLVDGGMVQGMAVGS